MELLTISMELSTIVLTLRDRIDGVMDHSDGVVGRFDGIFMQPETHSVNKFKFLKRMTKVQNDATIFISIDQ